MHQSPAIFAAWAIFSYAAATAAAACPSGDLLKNSGFEASTSSIKPWQEEGKAGRIIIPGHHSSQSWGISSPNVRDSEILQSFKACADQSLYQFEFDHLFNSPTFDVGDTLIATVGNLQIEYNAGPKDNGSWITNKQVFAADPGHKTTVDISVFNSYEGGSIQIDNVKASVLGTLVPEPDAKNLIKNSGFESGRIAPWKVHPRNRCAVQSPGGFNKPGHALYCSELDELSQVLDTTPGVLYVLSFDSNTRLLDADAASFQEQFCATEIVLNHGRYSYSGPSLFPPFLKNNTWSTITQPFYAESRQTNLSFNSAPNYDGQYGNCEFLFDNFEVFPYEPPMA